jgi:hypothetical protein
VWGRRLRVEEVSKGLGWVCDQGENWEVEIGEFCRGDWREVLRVISGVVEMLEMPATCASVQCDAIQDDDTVL